MHKFTYTSSIFVSFVAAFAVTVFVGACSVPDDPTYGQLEGSVERIEVYDPETWQELARIKAVDNFRKFYGKYWQYHGADTFLTFNCTDPWTKDNIADGYTKWSFTLKDVWTCVGADFFNQTPFPECVTILMNAAADSHREQLFDNFEVYPDIDEVTCKPHYYFLHETPPVEDFDPANVKAEDITREMIEAKTPPSWIKILGIAIVGGAVVGLSGGPGGALLPLLCTLGGPDHWSCPSDPAFAPGQTPQPDK